jgi:hypothetical protein
MTVGCQVDGDDLAYLYRCKKGERFDPESRMSSDSIMYTEADK